MFWQDELYTLMNELGGKGRVFRDEPDFQLQLFARMQELYGNVYVIEREYPALIGDERAKIDFILRTPEGILPIELKYKLKQNHTPIGNAQYPFSKDIWRIEQLLSQKEFAPVGYAVFLTNDPRFWNHPHKESTANYREFSMYEGCVISGTRTWWGNKNKEKTHHNPMWSRPLSFKGSYRVTWRDYNNSIRDASSQSGVFRYTLIEVNRLSRHLEPSRRTVP
jgi:hypothetical protein